MIIVMLLHILLLLLVGILSGIASITLFFAINNIYALYFIPGLTFGLALGLYFSYYTNNKLFPNGILFAFISSLSFFLAIHVFLLLVSWFSILPALDAEYGIPIIMGALYTLLICIALSKLLFPLTRKQIIFMCFVGGILVAVPNPLSELISIPFLDPTFSMVILWQTIMAGIFGCVTAKTKIPRKKTIR